MHTSIKEEEVGARERVTIAFGGGGVPAVVIIDAYCALLTVLVRFSSSRHTHTHTHIYIYMCVCV